jgi:regulator of sigma E protease
MHSDTLLLMSGTWMKVIQLFVSLSLLIVLHEFGHFFFARLFKTRVEKFYLFFDFLFPFSGLLNFALFKKKKGDTEYGIGWFPLGGYVKIAGMVDESMDKEQMALPPQPWEYRSKKPYQRLFIMLGGIIVNTVLAIVLYIVIFSVYGEEHLLTSKAKYGIAVDSLGRSIGLQNGDMIRSVDKVPVERFDKIPMAIIYSKDQTGTIEITRDGKDMTLNIPSGTVRKMLKMQKGGFITAALPAVVDSVSPNSIAAKAQMQVGDSIVAMNGQPVRFRNEVAEVKQANYGKPMTITVMRNNTSQTFEVVVPKDSSIGIAYVAGDKYLEFEKIKYNPIQAVSRGFVFTFEQFGNYISQFKLLFTSKEVSPNEGLGGIISFGKIFPSEFDMRQFLMLTAFVSIILAFMNLLPIPGLDGGYVIFLLFEMITGKQVSEKVMERATTVGLVLLLTLMVYANGLDIFRLFKH